MRYAMRHVFSNCGVAVREPQQRWIWDLSSFCCILWTMQASNSQRRKRIVASVNDYPLPNGGTVPSPPEILERTWNKILCRLTKYQLSSRFLSWLTLMIRRKFTMHNLENPEIMENQRLTMLLSCPPQHGILGSEALKKQKLWFVDQANPLDFRPWGWGELLLDFEWRGFFRFRLRGDFS